jgi:hypothetical protein
MKLSLSGILHQKLQSETSAVIRPLGLLQATACFRCSGELNSKSEYEKFRVAHFLRLAQLCVKFRESKNCEVTTAGRC